jgi:muconolactone D-isomerase
MLYMAHMIITPPPSSDTAAFEDAKLREKTYAQELQRSGKWQHLWRVVGEYANYSVFDVASNDELHELLSKLPLFPYMQIKVTPLAAHPSAIAK